MQTKKIIVYCFLYLPCLVFANTYNSEDLSGTQGRKILCSVLSKLQDTNGKNVWPGFKPLESPLIVKFSDGIFGYGKREAFEGWNQQTSEECTLYIAPTDFNAPNSPIIPYLDFKNEKAFFFDTTVKSKLSVWLLSAIVHERFHRYQWENFANVLYFSNSIYTGHSSLNTVSEVLLENDRLTNFLISKDYKSLIDFFSVSVLREPTLPRESINWELDQQISEGTATFVQLKAFEAVESEFNLRFRQIWKDKMIGNLTDSMGIDGMIKWRHYAVGSIICDFLDRHSLDESWKIDLQTEKSVSLFRKALPLIRIEDPALKKRGQAILHSNEGDLTRMKASKMILQYMADIQSAKDQIEMSAIQIKIHQPDKQCSGGGVSERTYYLPEGGTLSLNYSGSYQCEKDYKQLFKGIPVIYESQGILNFGSEAVRIWINSKELPIHSEGDFSFLGLRIEGNNFSLDSAMRGTLHINGSLIKVQFRD